MLRYTYIACLVHIDAVMILTETVTNLAVNAW